VDAVVDQEYPEKAVASQLIFNYVKSNFHRVIHIDEVLSGITPNGEIYVELCSERPSLPKQVVVHFDDDGEVKDTSINPTDVKSHIDREVEASIVMSLDTAESLFLKLFDLIESLKEGEDEDGDDHE
jgi:hypothetical protein